VSVDNWIEFWSNHDGPGYHELDRCEIEKWERAEIADAAKLEQLLKPVPYALVSGWQQFVVPANAFQ
jgi:hypothetical protein